MASELRVNTLKDASGNNSIGMSYVAGGSAKFFFKYSGSGTTFADSLNMTSATDNGTGDYTFTIASDMASINYSISGTGANSSGSGTNTPMMGLERGSTPTATAFTVACKFNQDSSLADTDQVFGTGHGDLA